MVDFDVSATYSPSQLAEITGIATATVSYYVRLGLLPRVPFRGGATRYTADHLLRLLAIRRLNVRMLGTAEVKRVLNSASREKLFALAGIEAPAKPAPKATGPYRGRRQHVCHVINLAPGIDLHVSSTADDEAQRVATEIVERYGR